MPQQFFQNNYQSMYGKIGEGIAALPNAYATGVATSNAMKAQKIAEQARTDAATYNQAIYDQAAGFLKSVPELAPVAQRLPKQMANESPEKYEARIKPYMSNALEILAQNGMDPDELKHIALVGGYNDYNQLGETVNRAIQSRRASNKKGLLNGQSQAGVSPPMPMPNETPNAPQQQPSPSAQQSVVPLPISQSPAAPQQQPEPQTQPQVTPPIPMSVTDMVANSQANELYGDKDVFTAIQTKALPVISPIVNRPGMTKERAFGEFVKSGIPLEVVKPYLDMLPSEADLLNNAGKRAVTDQTKETTKQLRGNPKTKADEAYKTAVGQLQQAEKEYMTKESLVKSLVAQKQRYEKDGQTAEDIVDDLARARTELSIAEGERKRYKTLVSQLQKTGGTELRDEAWKATESAVIEPGIAEINSKIPQGSKFYTPSQEFKDYVSAPILNNQDQVVAEEMKKGIYPDSRKKVPSISTAKSGSGVIPIGDPEVLQAIENSPANYEKYMAASPQEQARMRVMVRDFLRKNKQ